ncbi:zinc finger CCCH domain-containing protein 55-like [Diospyros lotus]|uniref:zinc finger CCCH domain-containing protein 55-like n=1 Tax=Diospyros lotus TaxID=55363 RepID=UPI002253C2B2|nr:zinc finger CCCH domain-containing protein 55-like [Diospyros lotus]
MDEATKVVFSRIQSLDPENASKIMGYVFMQDFGDQGMIRLAFGPGTVLLSLVNQAKAHLGLSSNSWSASSSPSPSRPIPLPQTSSPLIVVPNNAFHVLNSSSPSSPWSVSGFSEHYRSPSNHASPRPAATSLSYAAAVVNGSGNNVGPLSFSAPPTGTSSFSLPPSFPVNKDSCGDNDEFSLQVQDHLSFLDDSPSKNADDFLDPIMSPSGNAGDHHHHLHSRSYSVSDDVLFGGGWNEDGRTSSTGLGWRPCVYFARGFCKNGSACKFLHGGFADSPDVPSTGVAGSPSKLDIDDRFDEFLKMKAIQQQQRFLAAGLGGGPFPYNKSMINDSPRSTALGLGGSGNSSSRQIYLTFPADSTFKEEDVSNYFSKFGPVQDVRIPFQQKRMFGFVTFHYPETVKAILAKGNPHFVCDSRVLVKPYKEKGKAPEKKQLQQQLERVEYSPCLSPTGLDSLDFRETYDLPSGPRMFRNSQDMMIRQLEQAEFQHAIELQGRRLMNLQFMDLNNPHHGRQFQSPHLLRPCPVPSPTQSHLQTNPSLLLQYDGSNKEDSEEHKNCLVGMNSPTLADADQQHQQNVQQEVKEGYSNTDDDNNNNGNGKERCSDPDNDDLPESLEHILPDNLLSSPTKSAGGDSSIFATASAHADDSTLETTPSSNSISIRPATAPINVISMKSCYFQMPR